MKQAIVCILVLTVIVTGAFASEYEECIRYKLRANTNLTAWVNMGRDKPWMLEGTPTGIIISRWNQEVLGIPKPTLEELDAVNAAAEAWHRDWIEVRKADFENWSSDELRALIKVLLDEINVLRQKAGLEPRTADQLKTAIKAKM